MIQLPSLQPVQPVILLTGFLGAGKTTLLRQLLTATQHAGLQTSVILNDYADAGLDSATLESLTDQISPLTAACACCEGLDFLLDLSIAANEARSDLLFIELNGTADPLPIVEAFTLLEEKIRLHPRWQVCVIDVREIGQRGSYRDIEALQLQTASHLVLSHQDAPHDPEAVIATVRAVNPYAPILTPEELCTAALALGRDKRQRLLAPPAQQEIYAPAFIADPDQHALTHQFTSCKLTLPPQTTVAKVQRFLQDAPPNALRIKLLTRISGRDANYRYLYERVGTTISKGPQKVRLGAQVPNSIILIGPDLSLPMLKDVAEQHFGQA